ncbi:MAG: cytochrome c family protein [Paracoccaceae bacterium]
MDTMTATKTVASLCGALLLFLLGKWVAEIVYHVDGHGQQAYVIEVESAGADTEEEQVSFEELMASADVEKGAKVFKKCTACHKVDGSNGTGPHLDGVVNRAIGGVAGFGYSSAMASHGGEWTPEELDAFLTKPSGYVSGTSMSFAGLRKQADRVNVIAYLQSLGN